MASNHEADLFCTRFQRGRPYHQQACWSNSNPNPEGGWVIPRSRSSPLSSLLSFDCSWFSRSPRLSVKYRRVSRLFFFPDDFPPQVVKVFFCESSLLYKKSFSLKWLFVTFRTLYCRECVLSRSYKFSEKLPEFGRANFLLSQISKKNTDRPPGGYTIFGMVYRPGSRALRNCSIGARRRYSHFAYFAHLCICTFCQF